MTWTAAKTAETQATIRARLLLALAGTPLVGLGSAAPQRRLVDDVASWLATESGHRAALAASIDISDPSTSDDDWIDLWALFFDEARTAAIAAVWDVPMTSTSLPLTIQPSTKVTIQSTSGPYFDLAQAAAAALPASLRFVARVAGTAGNVAAATLTKLITGPSGLSFTTIATLYTSGTDEESDAALVVRCLGKWARLGAGWTLEAFDYLIPTAAPTVTRWRVRDDAPLGLGTVLALLANATGAATAPEVALVQTSCSARGVKPVGSGAFTARAATAFPLSIVCSLVGDGSNSTLAADVAAALAAFCNAFPLGPSTLQAEHLIALVLGGAYPAGIPIDAGSEVLTIYPSLPGFGGVKSLVTLTCTPTVTGSLDVPVDAVLVPTVSVTVT